LRFYKNIKMSEKIKSIKATRYDKKVKSVLSGEITTVESPLSIKKYDKDGNLIYSKEWGENQMISEFYQLEYQNNKPIKRLIYSDENELAETEYYEYDSEGLLSKTIIEYLDGSQDITTHTYNENKKRVQSNSIDDEGDQGEQEYWEYEGENLVHYRMINDFGDLEEEQKMSYNAQNLLIEKSVLNNMNETNFRWTYEYDNDGKLILETRYSSKGNPIEEIQYEYNNKCELILEKTENAKQTLIKEINYDEQGNEIYVRFMDDEKELTLYEIWRTFDENKKQLSTRVLMYGNGESPNMEYEVKYEYELWAQ